MPISEISFFCQSSRDTQFYALSYVAGEELFNHWRQVSPKMKIDAELALLSHRQAESVSYQQKLLIHMATHMDFYNNHYPANIKEQYLNKLTQLLKNATHFKPLLRILGLFVKSSLSNPGYKLDSNLQNDVLAHLESTPRTGTTVLYLPLCQDEPHRIDRLWDALIPRINHIFNNHQFHRAEIDKLIALTTFSTQARSSALFDALKNLVPTYESLLEYQFRITPYLSTAKQMELFNYLTKRINNKSEFYLPESVYKGLIKLIPTVDTAGRADLFDALVNRLNHFEGTGLSEANPCIVSLMPYCQDQHATMLNLLTVIINNNAGYCLGAINCLIALFPTRNMDRSVVFTTLISALDNNYMPIKRATILGLGALAPHYDEAQKNTLYDVLLKIISEAPWEIREEAIKGLSRLIPYCSHAQQMTLLPEFLKALNDRYAEVGKAAVSGLVELIRYCGKAEQILVIEALTNLNSRYVALQGHTIANLINLIPFSHNIEQTHLLLNTFIKLSKDNRPLVYRSAITGLLALSPFCDAAQLDIILNDINKELKNNSHQNLWLAQADKASFSQIIPYCNPTQKMRLFDELTNHMNELIKHYPSLAFNSFIAFMPYCNEVQTTFLFDFLTKCHVEATQNVVQLAIIAMTKLFPYSNAFQKVTLFDILINKLNHESNNVRKAVISSLTDVIPYCDKTQKVSLLDALINKLEEPDEDILEASLTALNVLTAYCNESQQTVILKTLFDNLHRPNEIEPIVTYKGIMAMLSAMTDSQHQLLLSLFKSKLAQPECPAIFINAFSQMTLQFIHADKIELIEQIVTLTETVGSRTNLNNRLGLELINNLCNQHLFNHVQNRPAILC